MTNSRLSRSRDALMGRDWLGLLFEIAVVTLGVLLAFQIDQWGDERQRAEEERHFLERLDVEYGRAIEELREVIAHHDRIMREFLAAFSARGDAARLRTYSTEPNFGCRAGYLGTAPFSDTASQELISSGRLNTISDPALRAEIRDLTTAQAWLRDRAAAGTNVVRDAEPSIIPYYRYEILPDGRTTCRVLWSGLFSDPEAVTAAVRTYRMHERVGGGRKDLLRMTQGVRSDIRCRLGKAECKRS